MASLRNETNRQRLVHRLRMVTPATKPNWGSFDAPRMLSHLIDSLLIALGETSTQSLNRTMFQYFPLKHLVIYVIPFPKGVPTTPEFLATAPAEFEADRRRLLELMDRLADLPRAMGPPHPLLGLLTNDEWNALQSKHIAHHLKQFGC